MSEFPAVFIFLFYFYYYLLLFTLCYFVCFEFTFFFIETDFPVWCLYKCNELKELKSTKQRRYQKEPIRWLRMSGGHLTARVWFASDLVLTSLIALKAKAIMQANSFVAS